MKVNESLLFNHPQWNAAEIILQTLQSRGKLAYLAGGCVRDALLGRVPGDLDIATNALPDEVETFFTKTVAVGKTFGVIKVIEAGSEIEVATFRSDGAYQDGRRPDEVIYSTPQDDAQRRDFTINALFYDPLHHRLFDFVNGVSDLQAKMVRTVGNAKIRFSEDHLRLLRAIRFSVQLDFTIESQTFLAIQNCAGLIQTVSAERIRDELGKLLMHKKGFLGLKSLQQAHLLAVLHSELAQDFAQNPVFYERLLNQSFEDFEDAFAALFLSLAVNKNLTNEKIEIWLEQLKLSRQENQNIIKTIKTFKEVESFWERPRGQQIECFFDKSVQRGFRYYQLSFGSKYDQQIKELIEKSSIRPSPYLNGNDVKNILSGSKIGRCLKEAYWAQLEERFANRETALKWLDSWLRENS